MYRYVIHALHGGYTVLIQKSLIINFYFKIQRDIAKITSLIQLYVLVQKHFNTWSKHDSNLDFENVEKKLFLSAVVALWYYKSRTKYSANMNNQIYIYVEFPKFS